MNARGGLLLLCLVLAAVGCASKRPTAPPPVALSAGAWQQVDRELINASLAATGSANDYARRCLEPGMARADGQPPERGDVRGVLPVGADRGWPATQAAIASNSHHCHPSICTK